MKTRIPVIIVSLIAVMMVVGALRPAKLTTAERSDFDLRTFAQLPVLEGGRMKPMDSVARNAMIFFRGKQRALDAQGKPMPAVHWLADVLFDQKTAAQYRIFRVDDPDLLGLLGSSGEDIVHFSYAQLLPSLAEIDRQARLAPEEAALRTRYQRAVLRLRSALIQYQHFETAIIPHSFGKLSIGDSYARFVEILPQAAEVMRDMQAGASADPQIINDFVELTTRFRQVAESRAIFTVPEWSAESAGSDPARWNQVEWSTPGTVLLARMHSGQVDPVVSGYMSIADAWQRGDVSAWDRGLSELELQMPQRVKSVESRTGFEFFFNQLAPFYLSLQLYVLAFLAVSIGWLINSAGLNRTAFWIITFALIPHSFGLAARVFLSGYAPVTNLYSSAVFVGWFAIVLAVPFEAIYRNGLAAAGAALTGVCSLIIAHNLALSGGSDTMEMMRAVLDSNFWLSTHVITIVMGYSAVFLAGALGLIYVIRGVVTKSLDGATARSLERMVYATICFALLFSFIGTVLGGVWADQSWGRFWGWDPKENGALMIVLWTAMMLHAKRIRMAGQVGFMQLAIGGNIITSWSWFGTNLLGVGLHSYGFMDRGFFWLMVFWISQVAVILLANIPARRWRSGFPAT